jgi:adenylate cyclase
VTEGRPVRTTSTACSSVHRGTPANLAARLTALAGRNDVLADAQTAEALNDHPALALRVLPPAEIRGLGAVTPYVVTRRQPAAAD